MAGVGELVQLFVNGLVAGSIIALGAIGLTLIYGTLRIVNFAHGDYLTFGAYMALFVTTALGVGMVAGTIFAIVATAILAVVLEFVLWRPMRAKRAGVISLFITSIGLALVLRHLLFLWFGAATTRFEVDVFQVYDLEIVRLSLSQLVAIGLGAPAIAAVGLFLARTRVGKGMRALSDDRGLASVAGIDVDRVTTYTWLLGGGLAGMAGVLQGLVQNAFEPNMGFTLLLPIFAAVVLGGVGSAYGALAGGLLIGLAMEVSTWSVLAGGVSHVYKLVVAFVVLILVLLVRPQGIFGRARGA